MYLWWLNTLHIWLYSIIVVLICDVVWGVCYIFHTASRTRVPVSLNPFAFIHSNYVPWVLLFCCLVPVFGDLILIVSDLYLIVVGLFWTCLKKISNHLREFYFSWSMHIGSTRTIQWKTIHRWNHSLWRSLLLWVSSSIFVFSFINNDDSTA